MLDEEALARPWAFRGRQMEVRYALYRTLEDAQEVHVRVSAADHPESRRILALAQQAFGSLRALLVGVPETLLDKSPRAGEWSIRETILHMVAVEQRYALQTTYAIDRTDADPMRIADSRLPSLTPATVVGEIEVLLARLADARAETGRRLGDVAPAGRTRPARRGGYEIAVLRARLADARAETGRRLDDVAPAGMTRPTIWGGYEIDVRFRLHRFAAHVVEHTIQCEQTLLMLGWRPAEGRQIARCVAAAVSEIEGLGAVKDARELEARLVERVASVAS